MLTIIDYGYGNLRSVQKGLEHIGAREVRISANPDDLSRSDGLILPGVGAFRDAMRQLNDSGLTQAIKAAVANNTPLLGICLGMQLLMDTSHEFGQHSGLGLIPGSCQRFDETTLKLKVPHIGWNTVHFPDNNTDDYFYFVHSYHCVPDDPGDQWATTTYGRPFTSALRRGTIRATQFHPEKSSTAGLRLLADFARECDRL